jgi:hypothetical protein
MLLLELFLLVLMVSLLRQPSMHGVVTMALILRSGAWLVEKRGARPCRPPSRSVPINSYSFMVAGVTWKVLLYEVHGRFGSRSKGSTVTDATNTPSAPGS